MYNSIIKYYWYQYYIRVIYLYDIKLRKVFITLSVFLKYIFIISVSIFLVFYVFYFCFGLLQVVMDRDRKVSFVEEYFLDLNIFFVVRNTFIRLFIAVYKVVRSDYEVRKINVQSYLYYCFNMKLFNFFFKYFDDLLNCIFFFMFFVQYKF